jgi:hypothetical protein
MKISEVLIGECISEVYFRYTAKLDGYANSSSDIPKLYKRASQDKEKSI